MDLETVQLTRPKVLIEPNCTNSAGMIAFFAPNDVLGSLKAPTVNEDFTGSSEL